MFGKKSKRVSVTESVMVGIERFKQAVEVMTGSPVSIISADVIAGRMFETSVSVFVDKDGVLRKKNLNREVEVSMLVRIPIDKYSGSIVRIEGKMKLVQGSDGFWKVLHDQGLTRFSLTENLLLGEGVCWHRQYDACWNEEAGLIPRVQVYEYPEEGGGTRMSFPSDRNPKDTYPRRLHPITRVGYTHTDAFDEEGWFHSRNFNLSV